MKYLIFTTEPTGNPKINGSLLSCVPCVEGFWVYSTYKNLCDTTEMEGWKLYTESNIVTNLTPII